jgi:glycosyltransferase involved in cell wall biosynthesis
MESPKISIIVPCYNQSEYISETLDSVLSQTYDNWECIIVNDGSTDNSEEVVSRFLKLDQRFRLITIPNKGLAGARNVGVSNSFGEYILPLDADDLISPNFLYELYITLNSDKINKISYSKAYKFGAVNEFWNLPEFEREKMFFKNQIYCTALYRKTDFLKLGGYDENMPFMGVEDWEFWIRMFKDGGTAAKSNESTFYYRTKEISMITSIQDDLKKFISLRKYIYKKHKSFYDSLDIELFNMNWLNITCEVNFQDGNTHLFSKYKKQLLNKIKQTIGHRNFLIRKKILVSWYFKKSFALNIYDVITI